MKRKTGAAALRELEGEVLFATINDPEGLLAGDLCQVLFRHCGFRNFERRAVAGRDDAFQVSAAAGALEDYHRDRVPAALREWSAAVDRWIYPDVIPLGFDPEQIRATDPETRAFRRIWRDDLTRALWTGLRWQRIVSDSFAEMVEGAGDYLQALKRQGKFNRQELNRLFWRLDCFGSAELTGVVAARLWPYLTGEKVFRYQVEGKEPKA